MASHRGLLHLNKLEDFALWCANVKGWVRCDTKGYYEKLRMRHVNHASPVILYATAHSAHLTIPMEGMAYVLYQQWQAAQRKGGA